MPFLKNDARLPVWQGFFDRARDAYLQRFADEKHSGGTPFSVTV
jgi:hypothetical protein